MRFYSSMFKEVLCSRQIVDNDEGQRKQTVQDRDVQDVLNVQKPQGMSTSEVSYGTRKLGINFVWSH